MSKQSNTFRKHKKGNFTVIDNNIFKNKEMSLKAKGLLSLLLSLSNDWEFSERGLTMLSKDGRDSVRTGLKELEDLNHLKRTAIRNETGQFIYTRYDVYEEPRLNEPKLDNPTLVKTPNKELSTKELSNKELSTKTIVRLDLFNEFWELYPKKQAKVKAKAKYLKEINAETHKKVMSHLNIMVKDDNWIKENGQYVPMPVTYLNQKRYNDVIKVKKTQDEKMKERYNTGI